MLCCDEGRVGCITEVDEVPGLWFFCFVAALLLLCTRWDARIRWCKDAVAFLALPKRRTALMLKCDDPRPKADDHGPLHDRGLSQHWRGFECKVGQIECC